MDEHSSGLIAKFKSLFQAGDEEDQPPAGPEQLEMLNNVESFFDTTIQEIMVPRTRMVTIESEQSLREAINLFKKTGHSRIPVQQETKDKIVGLLYSKDIFPHIDILDDKRVYEIMRKPFFVSYSQPIHKLLTNFKTGKIHQAIVIDEYGGVDGLITIEDVIEELTGEIRDEHDKVEEPSYQNVDEENLCMDADYSLYDFNELYQTEFNKEGTETIGGYLCHILGRIPETNEHFELDGIKFEVIESDDRHLSKLKILKPEMTDQT